MKKYFVLATVLGALALPVTVSTAMAEETKMEKAEEAKPGFFERQKERFQKWRESSAQEQEEAKEEHEKMEKRKERVAKAQTKKSAVRTEQQRAQKQARRTKAKERHSSLNQGEPTTVRNIKARGLKNAQNYRVKNINE